MASILAASRHEMSDLVTPSEGVLHACDRTVHKKLTSDTNRVGRPATWLGAIAMIRTCALDISPLCTIILEAEPGSARFHGSVLQGLLGSWRNTVSRALSRKMRQTL